MNNNYSKLCKKSQNQKFAKIKTPKNYQYYSSWLWIYFVSAQTTGPACVTDCRDRAKGDYQSCKGCDVYVICKGNGFIKDSVPCVEEGGQPTYWNPTDGKCTVEKSPLCQLQSVDETTTEQSTSLG